MNTKTNFTYRSGDGAKWGVSDFYDDFEAELRRALESNKDFDTGYYGVKKEIESGRISRRDGAVYVEVSVSDDFDTEGHGESSVPASALTDKSLDEQVEAIKQALDEARDSAGANQLDNKVVELYCVGRDKDGYSTWTFTYLRDVSGHGFEQPPGDSYHRWGWQEVVTEDTSDREACPPEIGAEVAEQIENAIHDGTVDDAGKDGVVIEGWRVKVAT